MSIAEKLTTVAENVPKVYEAGKKSEYDKFWDSFQDYGNRVSYAYGFVGWTLETFKPKYDIRPSNYSNLFLNTNIPVDLPAYLEEIGIELDLAGATASDSATNVFRGSKFTRVGEIPTTMSNNVNSICWGASNLVTIDKLILKDDGTQTFAVNNFNSCNKLENLIIEGTIGNNNFNVQWSTKLTAASLLSILTALSKDSTLASGKSITLATEHQAVIEGNAECLEQYNLAISAGWTIAFV